MSDEIYQRSIDFFITRVSATYALSEDHKQQLIAQADSLPLEELDRILSIIVSYENLIVQDGRNEQEAQDRQDDVQSGTSLLNILDF